MNWIAALAASLAVALFYVYKKSHDDDFERLVEALTACFIAAAVMGFLLPPELSEVRSLIIGAGTPTGQILGHWLVNRMRAGSKRRVLRTVKERR